MDAFLGRMTLRKYNEHWAFWQLNGPMGIRRLDWLFANLTSWLVSLKTGKPQPLGECMLPFGQTPEDQEEQAKQRKLTKFARVKAWAFNRSPEVVAARKKSHKDAASKRKRGKA